MSTQLTLFDMDLLEPESSTSCVSAKSEGVKVFDAQPCSDGSLAHESTEPSPTERNSTESEQIAWALESYIRAGSKLRSLLCNRASEVCINRSTGISTEVIDCYKCPISVPDTDSTGLACPIRLPNGQLKILYKLYVPRSDDKRGFYAWFESILSKSV